MTKQEFLNLTKQGIVVLDGATGSCLKEAGMPNGVCTELWALENKEVVINLQRKYAQAGSQIIYAPTFGANRVSLKMHELEDRLEELNRQLVALSKEAVGEKALVAGDISTTGKMLEFDISKDEMLEVYKEQIRILADAGVDLLVGETLLSVDEAMVILEAAKEICDLPVMITLTVQESGFTLYGSDAVDSIKKLQENGAVAVGLNCSVGPDQLAPIIAKMKEVATIPVIAKPNAGLPEVNPDGSVHYNVTEKEFAKSMKKIVEAGADIVGGCCGTTPKFIEELVTTVK